MNLEEFKETLHSESPPENINEELKALWYDWNGNWEKAHKIVQNLPSKNAAWVHAYLHRKEGDEANANYWYRRANKEHSKLTIKNEWEEIVNFLLRN